MKIQKKSFLGTGTKVVPDITIGKNSFVCAGSLVIRDVDENSKVFGVPAELRGVKKWINQQYLVAKKNFLPFCQEAFFRQKQFIS